MRVSIFHIWKQAKLNPTIKELVCLIYLIAVTKTSPACPKQKIKPKINGSAFRPVWIQLMGETRHQLLLPTQFHTIQYSRSQAWVLKCVVLKRNISIYKRSPWATCMLPEIKHYYIESFNCTREWTGKFFAITLLFLLKPFHAKDTTSWNPSDFLFLYCAYKHFDYVIMF